MVYYIMYRGQVTGPMSKEQIFAYDVNRDTMVSADGGEWRALFTYPDLMEMLSARGNSARQRMVDFGEAIKRGFSGMFTFTGRSSRSEFWWWMLFVWIVASALSMVSRIYFADEVFSLTDSPSSEELMGIYKQILLSPGSIISNIINFVFFLVTLSVSIRRLHDTGRSGWWVLLDFACCIGPIFLIVWFCQPSQEGDNEYGPMPNMGEAA